MGRHSRGRCSFADQYGHNLGVPKHFRRLGSTQEKARQIVRDLPASAYPPSRTLVVAWEQTEGQGRLARRWVSPAGGGLYCTLIHPLGGPEPPLSLPLSVGVALCRAARRMGVQDCQLKWPNDLVVGTRKLGGLLIGVVSGPREAMPTALIGFGINLRRDQEGLLPDAATSVTGESGAPTTAAALLAHVAPQLRDLPTDPMPNAELLSEYRSLLRHRPGDELEWRQGDQVVHGRFIGVDESGHIVIETGQGRRALCVGDIIES